jgi:hypothetical protein
MVVAFLLEGKDGLPAWANEFGSFGIVIVVFGAMLVAVRLNASTLWQDELKNIQPEEFHIEEYAPHEALAHELQDEIHQLIESKQAE